jgi:protein-S-isoprenylcysteine O-methyltransferase Ste14
MGPRTVHSFPTWPQPCAFASLIAGWLLMVAGGLLAASGVMRLGSNLTPLPYPKEESTLVQNGPYGLVRHPIYSGLAVAGIGWGLTVHGALTLIYAIILFVFFDIKSRREELWLMKKFREYPQYQKRVRKLIPWIY